MLGNPADFDHHSEEFASHWRDIYKAARSECPVFHSERHDGFWVLTRHRDVQQSLLNHKALSSAWSRDPVSGAARGGVSIPSTGTRIGFIEMDPPTAPALRKILAPWFSPAAIEAGRPRIQQISEWIIDGIAGRSECDVVADIAQPIPALLILDILGLPLDRWKHYADVLHDAIIQAPRSLDGLIWLMKDLRAIMDDGSADPEGLLAHLLTVTIDEARLDRGLIAELVMMLLFGGTDTTISTMSHMMLHLATNTEDRQRLIDAPELIPAAVEEFYRYYSPSMGMARTVSSPLTIGGAEIGVGERVLCAMSAANFDDTVFDAPDEFRIDRERNPHLAFGRGIHTCLGQHLARADAQIFLAEILTRLPAFTIDPAEAVPAPDRSLVNSFMTMPIRYEGVTSPLAERAPYPTLTAPRIAPA